MAPDETGRQAEFGPQGADFVLEQFAQGFDQFQPHLFGQAADIVVAFDRHRRAARKRHRFDHIGVQRALSQKFRAFDAIGVFLENVDEQPADDLALCFGIADTVQLAKEQFLSSAWISGIW